MILPCTAKMLILLGARPAALPDIPPSNDDWYLNLLWIDRRKCLLLTHAGTLFPVFVPDIRKADIAPIGPYVVGRIADALFLNRFLRRALHTRAGDYVTPLDLVTRRHRPE